MSSVAAVLLAAGASRRFGAADKLLADIGGEMLAVGVARRLRQAGIAPVVAVVRRADDAVAAALAPWVHHLAVNPAADDGMGGSIATGIAVLGSDTTGAMIVPADMPGLTADLITRLVTAFAAHGGDRIVHPVLADGAQRNPVLWPRRFFPELAALAGPRGGKALLARHAREAVGVPVAHPVEVADVDTPDDLAAWRAAGLSGRPPVT